MCAVNHFNFCHAWGCRDTVRLKRSKIITMPEVVEALKTWSIVNGTQEMDQIQKKRHDAFVSPVNEKPQLWDSTGTPLLRRCWENIAALTRRGQGGWD